MRWYINFDMPGCCCVRQISSILYFQGQLDQGFKEVESKMSALQGTFKTSQDSASNDRARLQGSLDDFKKQIGPVSYTHLTLPTNREV